MRKGKGNVSELLATAICILSMTVVVMSYMGSVSLLQQKAGIRQLARKYILRMETVGYLTDADRMELQAALEALGVSDIDLSGTTLQESSYGESIVLQIGGRLRGQYEFQEQRFSTAKN